MYTHTRCFIALCLLHFEKWWCSVDFTTLYCNSVKSLSPLFVSNVLTRFSLFCQWNYSWLATELLVARSCLHNNGAIRRTMAVSDKGEAWGRGAREFSAPCLLAGTAGNVSNTQVVEKGKEGRSILLTFIFHCFDDTIEQGLAAFWPSMIWWQ